MKEEDDQLLLICLNEREVIRRSLAATEYLLLLLQLFIPAPVTLSPHACLWTIFIHHLMNLRANAL